MQDFEQLYEDLKNLPKDAGFKMRETRGPDGKVYHIFDYDMVMDEDLWDLPAALESRGIMFEMTGLDYQTPVRIASRPYRKFFNLNENKFSHLTLTDNIAYVLEKVDGSLISTYVDHFGKLRLKSKGSLDSQQARDAEAWLNQDNPKITILRKVCQELAEFATVNMEWISPDNRIVVGYEEPKLVVHSVIDNDTGEVMDFEAMGRLFIPEMFVVKRHNIDNESQLLNYVQNLEGEEGVVVILKDGSMFKLKCEWYVLRHRARSYITSDNHLWESVANGSVDDIKPMFANDPDILERISNFEHKFFEIRKHLVTKSYETFEKFKDLDRKEFAIGVKGFLEKEGLSLLFTTVMNRYLGRNSIEDDVMYLMKDLNKFKKAFDFSL